MTIEDSQPTSEVLLVHCDQPGCTQPPYSGRRALASLGRHKYFKHGILGTSPSAKTRLQEKKNKVGRPAGRLTAAGGGVPKKVVSSLRTFGEVADEIKVIGGLIEQVKNLSPDGIAFFNEEFQSILNSQVFRMHTHQKRKRVMFTA